MRGFLWEPPRVPTYYNFAWVPHTFGGLTPPDPLISHTGQTIKTVYRLYLIVPAPNHRRRHLVALFSPSNLRGYSAYFRSKLTELWLLEIWPPYLYESHDLPPPTHLPTCLPPGTCCSKLLLLSTNKQSLSRQRLGSWSFDVCSLPTSTARRGIDVRLLLRRSSSTVSFLL